MNITLENIQKYVNDMKKEDDHATLFIHTEHMEDGNLNVRTAFSGDSDPMKQTFKTIAKETWWFQRLLESVVDEVRDEEMDEDIVYKPENGVYVRYKNVRFHKSPFTQ